MTYVIAQPCVDIKDRACVDECPVDCIYEGARTLYINAEECVDCGACEPVCPTEAIFYEDDVPEEWADYTRANIDFFELQGLGSPGGARAAGVQDYDDPMIAALPPQNQDSGAVTAYALIRLQDRGTSFVELTQETYEGQVVGENPRNEDMEVNVVREKQQTNMRSSTAETFENLTPPRKLTLEEALEFAADDECVEVTPEAVRIRKVILNGQERFRTQRRNK